MISRYWYSKGEMRSGAKKEISEVLGQSHYKTVAFQNEKIRLLEVDGETFSSIFSINRRFLFRGDYTAPASENDYSSARNFLTDEGLSGFSVSNDGWLTSLFSNASRRGFLKNVSMFIKNIANKLVCIVGCDIKNSKLIKLYAKYFNFKIVAMTIDDTKLMALHHGQKFTRNFLKFNERLYHVFMVEMGDKKEKIKPKVFDDYFEAKAFVEKEYC